jgi:hypothetical protein
VSERPCPTPLAAAAVLWFGATAAFGAALLFAAEPMIGRLLLPRLGGAPAVWGACVVFFQTCLLAGYAYAHVLAARVPIALQPVIHAAVCAASVVFLPLALAGGAPPPDQRMPVAWILGRLTASIGLPFFALCATAPLVQAWLGRTRHPSAKDPYFLFAASNAGSLVALVAYPAIVEPWLGIGQQLSAWSWGYGLLLALVAGCAAWLVSMRAPDGSVTAGDDQSPRPTGVNYGLWLLLAFVPSSLMLGVTTHATTDVAPVPLLWIVPLAIYLGTYVLAFMRRPPIAHERMVGAVPLAIVAVAFVSLVGESRLLGLVLCVHFAALFVIAMACHGELARTRPGARHLTAFYLVVSFGGALGGVFNGLLAPLLFRSVVEYSLVLVVACALRILTVPAAPSSPDQTTGTAARRALRTAIVPLVLLAAATLTVFLTKNVNDDWRLLVRSQFAIAFCVVAFAMRHRPARFAWVAGALLYAPLLEAQTDGALYVGRSFFGVHRVTYDPTNHRNVYTNGTTIHGLQSVLPERRHVAGAYYHPTGPAGDAITMASPRNVGIIGLGVGSLASYARAGQTYTFFEIDPVVAAIAESQTVFSFLADARRRGADVRVVVGDGRLLIERAPDASYDMIVLDAYSSDVVPVHLITTEAMAIYLRKLAVHGLFMMNVSSRYFDLGVVAAAVGERAGLVGIERLDGLDSESDREAARLEGKAVSRWIVLARSDRDLARIVGSGSPWQPLPRGAGSAWTDDHANILSAIAW